MRTNAFLVFTLLSSSIFSTTIASSARVAVPSVPANLDTALAASHALIKRLEVTLRELQVGPKTLEDQARLNEEIAAATAGFNQAASDITAAVANAPAPAPVQVQVAPVTASTAQSAPFIASTIQGAPVTSQIDIPTYQDDKDGSDFNGSGTKRPLSSRELPQAKIPCNGLKAILEPSATVVRTVASIAVSNAKPPGPSDSFMKFGVSKADILFRLKNRISFKSGSPAGSSASILVSSPAAPVVVSSPVTQVAVSTPASYSVPDVKDIAVTGNVGSSLNTHAHTVVVAPVFVEPITAVPVANARLDVVDALADSIISGTFTEEFFNNPQKVMDVKNIPTSNGQSLFEIAVRSGKNSASGLLIGCVGFCTHFANGDRALLFAVQQNNIDLVRFMMKIQDFRNEVDFVVVGAAGMDANMLQLISPYFLNNE